MDYNWDNRNAPGYIQPQLAYTSFMWDGGINHIEVQPLGPIENPVEMDEKLSNGDLTKLARLDAKVYKQMFQDAYG